MGANKNKNGPPQVDTQGQSGSDPRGRAQNQGAYQQQRYEEQVDPVIGQMAENFGRGSEQNFQDYGDIMGQYKALAGPGGYGEFAKTGGYSDQDMANMRARGVSPIRAGYANAEREIGRNRSLQGGYSPNANASLVKMAREQGQSMADASTNVEAELAKMKQAGRLAGLAGISNAVQGQGQMYGTTPGMASTFGNQLLTGIGQSGDFGSNMMRNEIEGQKLPGQYDTTMGKITDIGNMVATAAYPWLDKLGNKNPATTPPTSTGGATGNGIGPSDIPWPSAKPAQFPPIQSNPPQIGYGGSGGMIPIMNQSGSGPMNPPVNGRLSGGMGPNVGTTSIFPQQKKPLSTGMMGGY